MHLCLTFFQVKEHIFVKSKAVKNEKFQGGFIYVRYAYADWKSGNIGITSEKVKLRDYLASWLESVVPPNVKQMTYSNYKNTVSCRIIILP